MSIENNSNVNLLNLHALDAVDGDPKQVYYSRLSGRLVKKESSFSYFFHRVCQFFQLYSFFGGESREKAKVIAQALQSRVSVSSAESICPDVKTLAYCDQKLSPKYRNSFFDFVVQQMSHHRRAEGNKGQESVGGAELTHDPQGGQVFEETWESPQYFALDEENLEPAAFEKAEINREGLQTPLHVALSKGMFELAARLIKEGADLEAEDKKGIRPRHLIDEFDEIEELQQAVNQRRAKDRASNEAEESSSMSKTMALRPESLAKFQKWVAAFRKKLCEENQSQSKGAALGFEAPLRNLFGQDVRKAKRLGLDLLASLCGRHRILLNLRDSGIGLVLGYAGARLERLVSQSLRSCRSIFGPPIGETPNQRFRAMVRGLSKGVKLYGDEQALLLPCLRAHVERIVSGSLAEQASLRRDVLELIAIADEESVLELVKRGLPFDTDSPFAQSLLVIALASGFTRLAGYLLDLDVKPRSASDVVQDPLHVAVASGSSEMVELLIENGASTNTKVGEASSPLAHLAIRHLTEAQIPWGLISKSIENDVRDEGGATLLHTAFGCGKPDVIRKILNSYYCDINATNNLGMTAEEVQCRGATEAERLELDSLRREIRGFRESSIGIKG